MNTGDEKIKAAFCGWKAVNKYDIPTAAARVQMTGRTLARRMDDPSTLTLAEFRNIVKATGAGPEEVWQMVTGRRRT